MSQIPNGSVLKNFMISQCSRIQEIISSKELFDIHFQDIMNGIIPAINTQIHDYNITARKAIMVDVHEGLIEDINFKELHDRLTEFIKNKTYYEMDDIEKIGAIKLKLDKLDDDTFITMFHSKSPLKYSKQINNELFELIENIEEYENKMSNIRTKIFAIMKNNIETLYKYHANYVKSLINKEEFKNKLSLTTPLVKSQSQFIKDALSEMLLIR
jgi:hypothetical protein